MSTEIAVLAFLGALAATLAGSELLVWGLSRLGFKLGLAAGLLGLLTALGADGPEIASATAAVFSGAVDVGVGVIIGSNLFNLAALLGLPGVMSGRLPFRKVVPVVDGSASLLMTLIAAGLLGGLISPHATLILFGLVLAAYVVLLALPPRWIRRLPLPRSATRGLALLSQQIHPEEMVERPMREIRGWIPVWFIAPALGVIVAGSVVMVNTALLLGQRWHVPNVIVGTVALAGITGLPNLYAAIRLAQHGQGATVVSEAFNSNTLNLAAGLGLPALVLGIGVTMTSVSSSLPWLVALSLAAVMITSVQGGLTRLGGVAIIVGYAGFLGFLLREAG